MAARSKLHGVLMAMAFLGAIRPAGAAEPAVDRLSLVVPAAPGGGWDQTAHGIARILESTGIASRVEITNSPGAGGAIGLAEFVNGRRGDERALLVGGLVMISAIRASHATVSILQTTPIARLSGEAEVIVVPADSPLRTLRELVASMKAEPGAIAWAGGSAGGTDHLLLRLMADAIGVDATAINYEPFAGGGEGLRALLAHQTAAGVGGYAEFASGIRSGKLRALAVSSDQRLAGVPIPTLKEQGVNVALTNWRGVFAPPDLPAEARERLAGVIDRLVRQPEWQQLLRAYAWTDLYLPGEDFVEFVQAEARRTNEYFVRTESAQPQHLFRPSRGASSWSRVGWVAIVAAAPALLLVWYWRRQTVTARSLELRLREQLETARESAERDRDKARELLRGLGDEISRQFERWGLTSAEREVALLMLKGLRHKEIAAARTTSEHTVRQQALSVYKKAGLSGRTDLAAFFLEDLLLPTDPAAASPAKAAS